MSWTGEPGEPGPLGITGLSVSIFTCTHDTRFLPCVWESIKDQPFDEWVIVYNHGATPIEFGDTRVRSIVLKTAPGHVGFLKAFACDQCTGDILLELDHDDLLMPGAVEEVMRAFDTNPAAGFVYSNSIHSDGTVTSSPKRYSEEFGWRYRSVTVDGALLDECITFPPSPSSVARIWYAPNHLRAFRRTAYDAAGGYNPEMRVLDDLDLMCRLYCCTQLHHIDKPLYLYRVHGENEWLKHNKEIQEGVWPIYDRHILPMAIRWSADNGLRAMDLGGRFNGHSGLESVDRKDADVIADLNGHWPFEDSSVGVIRANDIFEHLRDPIHTMRECYRVLAPGGYLIGQVPSTDGRGAFQDPTHCSFFNENSFLYYTNSQWSKYIDTPVRFQAVRLFTTARDKIEVCWTRFDLVSLKDGHRPPGRIFI